MGKSYKKAIMIGLAFVLALTFLSVLPARDALASSPHGYGRYHGYMNKNMGSAHFTDSLPDQIVRDSQDEVTCTKWYYQRTPYGYKRIHNPCEFGTREYDYQRTYRRALRGVSVNLIPEP